MPWPSTVGGWRRLTGWVVLASLGVIGFGGRARAEVSPPVAGAPPIVAAQVGAAPVGSVESHPLGKRSHQGFFLRLSLGTTYLRESWNPSGGTPGTVYSGWGPSLETSVGKSIRPGLVLGGRWQFATVVDPNESFAGATYVVTQTARFVDIVSFFVDHYPDPRRGFHWGGSIGAVAVTDLDAYFGTAANGWGAALAAHVGYERYFFEPLVGGRSGRAQPLPCLVDSGGRVGGLRWAGAHRGARVHFRVVDQVIDLRGRALLLIVPTIVLPVLACQGSSAGVLVGTSEHFRLFVDPALPSPPNANQVSADLAALETDWADKQTMLGTPEGQIDYHLLTFDDVESACGFTEFGAGTRTACEQPDRLEVDAEYLPHQHELMHAYMALLAPGRLPISFVMEGAAQAIGCDAPRPTRPWRTTSPGRRLSARWPCRRRRTTSTRRAV